MHGKTIDLTGERYGKLVILGRIPTIKGEAKWLCQCDCGETRIEAGTRLRNAAVRACRKCSSKRRFP